MKVLTHRWIRPQRFARADLEDDLVYLRNAPALPIAISDRPAVPLGRLLGKSLDLASLVTALGIPQHEVMALLGGKKPLTPAMVGSVADVTGLSAQKVAEAVLPLPSGLVAEIDHPRWRSVWKTWADQSGVDEAAVRIEAGYGAFVMAARQTGGQAPDWGARLRHVVEHRVGRADEDS